jgi:integrase
MHIHSKKSKKSEKAAGLFFEDVKFNFRSPEESSIRVCRHVVYPRVGKDRPEIEEGFKNAGGGDKSVKELYLFPEAYAALKKVFKVGAKGLIFSPGLAEPFTYRQIQKAYDTAFLRAGLPYRGTHVLRHGGCRRVYNATGGDLALAQQLLGNTDLESTLVSAQRDKGALKSHVRATWGALKAVN